MEVCVVITFTLLNSADVRLYTVHNAVYVLSFRMRNRHTTHKPTTVTSIHVYVVPSFCTQSSTNACVRLCAVCCYAMLCYSPCYAVLWHLDRGGNSSGCASYAHVVRHRRYNVVYMKIVCEKKKKIEILFGDFSR